MSNDIGIRLSLLGAGQVQGGLTAVGDSLTQLDSRVLKVGDALKGFGAALLGTLSVGALGDFVKGAIESAAGLQQLSEQTGVSVESLGALRSVAKLSGTSMDDVRTALQRLSKNMVEARSGTGEVADTFKRLGISVTDSRGKLKTADQVFLELAKSTQKFEAGAELTTAQITLLGKAGANLNPVLADLAERGDLNGKITTEQARRADEFEKSMIRLQGSLKSTFNGLVLELLPALETLGGLVKVGIEVGLAYAAVFYGLPALYGAGAAAATAFGAAVFSASVATTTLSASLGVAVGQTMAAVTSFGLLKSAGLAVVAAFAGWEIGTWLRENFLEAQLAGIAFVEGTLVGWEQIKFAGQAMWLALQDMFYTVADGIGAGLATMLDGIATGLAAMGFEQLAEGARGFSDSVRTATRSGFDFDAELAKLQAQTDANIEGVRAITGDMAGQAIGHFKVADAAKKHKEALEAAGKTTKGASDEFLKAADAGAKLADSLIAQDNGLSGDFFDKWGKLQAALAAGKIGSDQFQLAQARLLEQQPYMKAALKDQEAATKALEESKKSYLQAFEAVREQELAEVEDLQKLVAKQREHNQTLGLSTQALQALESARLSDALAIAEQNLQMKIGEGLSGAEIEAYTLKVEALRELIRLRNEGAAKEAVLEEAKAARDAWAETVKSIQDGLTDALFRAFESGQGFLQAFKNLLVNTFKTTVLKPIIQAVMAPVTGAVGSLMGVGNAVAGTGSMLTGAGGLLGAAGTFGSGLGAGFSALFGEAGFSGAMSAGSIALGAGNIAGGLGTLIGAMGPIALGIGAIAALAKALGGGGTPHVGAAFTAGTDGSPSTMLTPGNAGGWQIGTTWSAAGKTSKAMQDTVQVFTESLAGTLGTALRTFGLQPGSVRAGFTSDNDDPSAGRITIRSASGKVLADMTKRYAASATKGFEEFAADAGKVLRDALVAADLPAEVDRILGDLGDTPSIEAVQRKVQRLSEIKFYTDAVGQLGGIFAKIAGSSFQARDSLIELAGGIEALMMRSRSFVQNYYSQGEQAAIQAQSLKQALAAIGLGDAALGSRADFRALVESRDVNTEEGRKQLVGLLSLADSFASLSTYLSDQGTNLDALAATAPQIELLQQAADASAATVSLQQQAVESTQQVVEQVQALRQDTQDGLASLASISQRMTKLLESWDNGGSMLTSAA